MKKYILILSLLAFIACKKKTTTPDPEPQPTTTGSTPTGNTVKVVYTPGANYGFFAIKWEYDYNTVTSDSGYTDPPTMTKSRLVQGDSVRLGWSCHTTSVGGTFTNATVDVYVNNVLKQTWTAPNGDVYYKVK